MVVRNFGGINSLTDNWKEIKSLKASLYFGILYFVCVCNVNLEEIFLYSMLNP